MTTAFQPNAFQNNAFQIWEGDGVSSSGKKRIYQPPPQPKLPPRLQKILDGVRRVKPARIEPQEKAKEPEAQEIEAQAVQRLQAGLPLLEIEMLSIQWGAVMFPMQQPPDLQELFLRQVAIDLWTAEQDDEEAILFLLLAM